MRSVRVLRTLIRVSAFTWGVIGSVAGVMGAAAAIVFGLIPLLNGRRKPVPEAPDAFGGAESPARAADVEIHGTVEAGEVAGYAAGVLAERPVQSLDGTVRVRRVKKGGKAVGVHLDRLDDGRDVR
jgi:hypothetical protein